MSALVLNVLPRLRFHALLWEPATAVDFNLFESRDFGVDLSKAFTSKI